MTQRFGELILWNFHFLTQPTIQRIPRAAEIETGFGMWTCLIFGFSDPGVFRNFGASPRYLRLQQVPYTQENYSLGN